MSVFGRIDNLFDRRYENPTGFLGAGLAVYGGVRVTDVLRIADVDAVGFAAALAMLRSAWSVGCRWDGRPDDPADPGTSSR